MSDEKKNPAIEELGGYPWNRETLPYMIKYIMESLREAGLLEGKLENGEWKHRVPPVVVRNGAESVVEWKRKVVEHLLNNPVLTAILTNLDEVSDFLKASLKRDN